MVFPIAGSIIFIVSLFTEISGAEQILGCLMLAIAGLNIIVDAFPSRRTYEGQLVLENNGTKKIFSLELAVDPERFEDMDSISLKVVNHLVEEDA
jgi:putative Mn2+ efflux pump MntP